MTDNARVHNDGDEVEDAELQRIRNRIVLWSDVNRFRNKPNLFPKFEATLAQGGQIYHKIFRVAYIQIYLNYSLRIEDTI